ncbi:MAG: immune inhibitor A [Ignavibacteriaceae bacterium]|nr:immune inhibitor A [Ignavibacteriaceae bacterium]
MIRKIYLILLSLMLPLQAQQYQLISVSLTSHEDLRKIAALGIETEHAHIDKESLSAELFISMDEAELLSQNGIGYAVLIPDWKQYYDARPALTEAEKAEQLAQSRNAFGVTGFGYGSMGGYYTFAEVVAQLDTMFAQFPNLITQKFSIGTSVEGRTIWAVKISDNPNLEEPEPRVLYDALIHAREPQAMATVIYYMYYLLENYNTNPEVKYLVDNREMYFVPVVNPDGYEWNRINSPNGGGMWRKNRYAQGSTIYGVDLNRNYGYMWAYDNIGSSGTPSSETYRGPSAFSEPETRVIRDLAIAKGFKSYINYHSYNNSIIYPWGYTNALTPDSNQYRDFAASMAQHNGYTYGTSYQTLAYNSNGTGRDWMYGEQTQKPKVFGFVFEVGGDGDGFWPSQSRIIPLAQQNIRPNLYLAWIAGGYPQLSNYYFTPQYLNPGSGVELTGTIKNTGLSELTQSWGYYYNSNDPNISVSGIPTFMSAIPPGGTAETGVGITVLPTAPVDYRGKIYLDLFMGQGAGTYTIKDSASFRIGTPVFVYNDTTNNPAQLWTITATPGTSPKWEATTSLFYSAPNSYTDSRTGSYANSATVTLQSTAPVSLEGISYPVLTFKTRYDIETRWDCAIVQVSTNNGSAWTALTGKYTKPASGSGTQIPAGTPIYDGTATSWLDEEMSLQQFANQNILIRFQLKTDGSQVRDGWYLDDIGIYYYGIVPVELTSFTAVNSVGNALLRWTTVTEQNNAGFAIERSTDGIAWEQAGYIRGAGTTTEQKEYQFTEPITGGTIHYRLKQIDFNGSYSYYGPVTLSASAPEKFELLGNYPNPFNPETSIRFSLPEAGSVSLIVYDVNGNEIKKLIEGRMEAGYHSVPFNSGGLASGVYIYKLTSGSSLAVKKMILMR